MFLTAKKVPYSSTVGQSVLLLDENGRVVCQLALLNVNASWCGQPARELASDIAELICLHFNT